MRIVFAVFVSLLLMGCAENNVTNDYRPSPKSKLVYELSKKVFVQLKEKKNLCPCECCGGGSDQIKLLHWGFDYYKEIDIKEARELLMVAGNQFLDAFNSDERIRPYLATYPLTPKNIEIRIFLQKPNGSELEPEKLHVISMIDGFLNYKIGRLGTERLKRIHRETYEEATAKLSAQ